MTESEWLSCREPRERLSFLRDAGKLSERKGRLLAAACCRQIWGSITEPCSREAVTTGERYADGQASLEELEAAFTAADRAFGSGPQGGLRAWNALDAARLAAHPEIRGLADGTATAAAMAAAFGEGAFWENHAEEQAHQSVLLRDIFGPLPFRPVTIAPSLLQWREGLMVRLAQAAYGLRSLPDGLLEPVRLAVLADALEDAGCQDAEILGHLRGEGPHVRGCWCVDLVLGRK
jgi:hypothetical protein